jgi:hypothetical protein
MIWISLFLNWCINSKNFEASLVKNIHGVPWFLYPTLLGISGFLSFIGTYTYFKKKFDQKIGIFILFFLYTIIFGRLLTIFNINYFFIGYRERRIIPFSFASTTILATFPILFYVDKFKTKHFQKSLLISLIIFSGITSTLLSIENQTFRMKSYVLNEDQQKQIQILSQTHPDSIICTYSISSYLISEFASLNLKINLEQGPSRVEAMNNYFKYHVWHAKSPELILNSIAFTGHPSQFYLSEWDLKELQKPTFIENYVINNLLKSAPLVYNDSKAYIYRVPSLTPPSESGNVVLLLPEKKFDPIYYYAYAALSLAGFNYTTSSILDIQSICDTVVVPSEALALTLLKMKEKLDLQIKHIIILNLDGQYGSLADVDYPGSPTSPRINVQSKIIAPKIVSKANTSSVYNAEQFFSLSFKTNNVLVDYLNLKPLINSIEEGERILFPILGNITRVGVGKLNRTSNNVEASNVPPKISFKKAEFTGNISIKPNSLIISNKKGLKIEIFNENFLQTITSEPEFVTIARFDNITLYTNFMKIIGGSGFYYNLMLNETNIFVRGSSSIVILYNKDGSISTIRGENLKIKLKMGEVSLRKPIIKVNGKGNFEDLRFYDDLEKKRVSLRKINEIEGEILFTGIYGDTFSIANNFYFHGEIKRSEEIYDFDERRSIVNTIPFLFIILGISLFYFRKRILN